jgi:hypothetical protein
MGIDLGCRLRNGLGALRNLADVAVGLWRCERCGGRSLRGLVATSGDLGVQPLDCGDQGLVVAHPGSVGAGQAVFNGSHFLLQVLIGFEYQIDDVGVDADARIARMIEQGLHFMRHRLHPNQTQKPGQTLDRVKRPEDGVNGIGERWVLLQLENAFFDRSQMLLCFEHEVS